MDQAAVTFEIAKWAIGTSVALVAMTIAIMTYLQRGFANARHGNDNRMTAIIAAVEKARDENREEMRELRKDITHELTAVRERVAKLEHSGDLAAALNRLVDDRIGPVRRSARD